MKNSCRCTTIFLLLYTLFMMATSCKKDEPNLLKTEILVSRSWKILSSKTNNVANIIDECEKDNVLIFSANRTYTWDPATIKCDESETSYSGTWSLSTDEKTMIVDGDTATIIELTQSKFTFSITYDNDIYEATYISF